MLAIASSSVGEAVSLCTRTPNCLPLIRVIVAVGSYTHPDAVAGKHAVTSMAADLVACFLVATLTVMGSFDATECVPVTNNKTKVSAMCDNLIRNEGELSVYKSF